MDIRTLQIADIELPPSVERLRDLAYDLWWSWSPAGHPPLRLDRPRALAALPQPRPAPHQRGAARTGCACSPIPSSGAPTRRVIQDLDAYRARPRWFDAGRAATCPAPSAYFSMEFGIHESLGVYSGGLGVLAGDHCKAASDLGVPLVGVGLLYRSGYFRQTVDADGFQQHIYPDYDFARLPVLPVQAPGGGVLTVPVDLPGPRGAGRGLEGPGGPGAGAHARHRHPPERSRGPADHRRPLRARPRDAPVPGDRARRGGRARPRRPRHPPLRLAHERGARGLPRPRARAGAGARRATASPTP